ncbi:MAG TPA: cupin domain-containing protein [Xanthobacteraceae bacterium]|nr:cupin domain-containing protein [Xanthobacteraceae bacterium]
MPKVDIAKAVARTTSNYPAPFLPVVAGRERMALGNLAGLTQFGVNLTRLKPGAASALRHWHDNEDEFVYVLEGEITLIEDQGETLLRVGEAAGFKAGVPNGHHVVNKSVRDAVYLEVGTRAERERTHYPDDDLACRKDGKDFTFTHKSGERYGE